MTQLQLMWKNPINDDDWDFVTKWDDGELHQQLRETIGQIMFETSTRQLWNYGDPENGATRTYEQVGGSIPKQEKYRETTKEKPAKKLTDKQKL